MKKICLAIIISAQLLFLAACKSQEKTLTATLPPQHENSSEINSSSNLPVLKGIEIETSGITLNVSETHIIKTMPFPANAELGEIIFVSSNPEIAAISDNGTITAISAGEVIITVFVKEHSNLTANITLTVTEAINNDYPVINNDWMDNIQFTEHYSPNKDYFKVDLEYSVTRPDDNFFSAQSQIIKEEEIRLMDKTNFFEFGPYILFYTNKYYTGPGKIFLEHTENGISEVFSSTQYISGMYYIPSEQVFLLELDYAIGTDNADSQHYLLNLKSETLTKYLYFNDEKDFHNSEYSTYYYYYGNYYVLEGGYAADDDLKNQELIYSFYKLKNDGTKIKLVENIFEWQIYFNRTRIYYTENNCLYSINLNGKDKRLELQNEKRISIDFLQDDMFLYSHYGETDCKGHLFNLNSMEYLLEEQYLKQYSFCYSNSNGIFVKIYDNDNHMFLLKNITYLGEEHVIAGFENAPSIIAVINEQIYCKILNETSSSAYVKMNIDGTEVQQIA